MGGWLKQSTAVTVKIGPFVDDGDFTTAATGLTIQKADVRLSKNGGNMAAASADQGASDAGAPHDELGHYDISLDTTDTNTLGRLRAMITKTGALAVWDEWMILPANAWDSLFGADKLQVDAVEWLGGTIATPTVTGVPEVDVTHVAGAATTATLDSIKAETASIQSDTNDLQSKLGTPSDLGGGATVAANLVDIEGQTDDIGAAGAGLTALPWNGAAWDAEVQSEVEDALVAHRLDELLNADSDIDGAAPPTVGSVVHELMSKTAGSFTYDQTTDSLEAIRDKQTDIETDTQDLQAKVGTPSDLGGGATVGANLADIEAQTDDIGAAGAGLSAIPWNGTAWDAEVQSEVDDALVARALDHLVNVAVAGTDVADNSIVAKLASKSATADWDSFVNTTDSLEAIADSGGGGPTADQIADAVWDELIAGHLGAGSTGLALNSASSAGDPWGTALPGAYGAGTAGKIVGDNLNATVSSRASQTSVDTIDDFVDTEVSAIKAKTDQLVFTVANRVDATATLTASAVQAIWDALTSALTTVGSIGKLLVDNVNATISSRSSHSAADVWAAGTRTLTSFGTLAADVWTAVTRSLTDKAGFSLGATGLDAVNPPADLANQTAARASFVGMIRALFDRFYNDVRQTATTQTVRNDGGTVHSTATVSDDATTQVKGKAA